MFNMQFAYAYGGAPPFHADFRVAWDDFIVEENLGFEPEGTGEHIYLQIQKRGVNTEWLAKQLAKFAAVKSMDVGFCGMKDRHAKTTQWFSLYYPKGASLDWQAFAISTGEDIQILCASRGSKKLRRGVHVGNVFQICLRSLVGDPGELTDRLSKIRCQGVPNYFGEQRFGHERQNLVAAASWLRNMRAIQPGGNRGIWMSAMRAYLFNCVLHQQILTLSIEQLIEQTAPLWGRGHNQSVDAEWENACLSEMADILVGLEHCGLQQERRSSWISMSGLKWSISGDELHLSFELGSGCYATSVLRELACVTDRSIKKRLV